MHDPAVVVALTNVVPSGSVSVTRTLDAVAGPAFDTLRVKAKGVPIDTGVIGALETRPTLAAAPTAPIVIVTV